jgi:NADH:ubiquinone oxidoreductase subunit F (NADH-binding)
MRKLLIGNAHIEGIQGYDVYRKNGGYASVEKALKKMSPEEIVEEVKTSGLRGRGGAGLNGLSWLNPKAFLVTCCVTPMNLNLERLKTVS